MDCRSCHSKNLQSIFSLGKTPLANRLLKKEQLGEVEPLYHLDLVFCEDCSLVQITETVPPEVLFSDYVYFSSNSDTMIQSMQELSYRLGKNLDEHSLVLEIASNDGYLLQHYKEQGIAVLGIDPAQNIAKVANERGIPTLAEFFSSKLADQLKKEEKQADVIHANNVLAHVPDLNGVVKGIATLLKPDGCAVIEVPYVGDLVETCAFDTIYHEHLCYFSLIALDALFARHDLLITDVERLSIHGGSLRLFVNHAAFSTRSNSVLELLDKEKRKELDKLSYYATFGSKVQDLKERLLKLLKEVRDAGKKVAAYGASAKGTTLLTFFCIGKDYIDFVVDRSSVKQGLFTPGTHLPIYSPEALIEENPDYVLLLTWNFAEEIMKQQEAFRKQGGQFIIPIPELKVA